MASMLTSSGTETTPHAHTTMTTTTTTCVLIKTKLDVNAQPDDAKKGASCTHDAEPVETHRAKSLSIAISSPVSVQPSAFKTKNARSFSSKAQKISRQKHVNLEEDRQSQSSLDIMKGRNVTTRLNNTPPNKCDSPPLRPIISILSSKNYSNKVIVNNASAKNKSPIKVNQSQYGTNTLPLKSKSKNSNRTSSSSACSSPKKSSINSSQTQSSLSCASAASGRKSSSTNLNPASELTLNQQPTTNVTNTNNNINNLIVTAASTDSSLSRKSSLNSVRFAHGDALSNKNESIMNSNMANSPIIDTLQIINGHSNNLLLSSFDKSSVSLNSAYSEKTNLTGLPSTNLLIDANNSIGANSTSNISQTGNLFLRYLLIMIYYKYILSIL